MILLVHEGFQFASDICLHHFIHVLSTLHCPVLYIYFFLYYLIYYSKYSCMLEIPLSNCHNLNFITWIIFLKPFITWIFLLLPHWPLYILSLHNLFNNFFKSSKSAMWTEFLSRTCNSLQFILLLLLNEIILSITDTDFLHIMFSFSFTLITFVLNHVV